MMEGEQLKSIESSDDTKEVNESQLLRRKKLFHTHAQSYYKRFRAKVDFEKEEKPRQILGILCLVAGLLMSRCIEWTAISEDNESKGIRHGFYGMCLSIIFYCYFQTRDGLLVRPHPGFWRIVHGINLCHLISMSILLTLPVETGRKLTRLVIPGLSDKSIEIFAGTLELNCDLSVHTLMTQIKKIWFYSHIVGYFAKMIITRDWIFCLILSVAFECVELSFQWLIPELKECWWDSLILDVGVSNMIGMIIGAITLRCVNCLPYDWFNSARKQLPVDAELDSPTCTSNTIFPWEWTKITLLKFQPFLWSTYHWQFFRSFERLVYAAAILVITLLTEFNVFMFMYAFDIPAIHPFHKLRVTYMCFLAINAVSEAYHYLRCRSLSVQTLLHLGPNSWLYSASILIETTVLVRYSQVRFHRFLPKQDIVVPWLCSFFFFLMWCFCHFVVVGPERLDLEQKAWKRCLILTKESKNYSEDAIANKIIQEGLLGGSEKRNSRNKDVVKSDSAAIKLLLSFLFLGNDPYTNSRDFIMSDTELRVIVKKMIQQRHQWGKLYQFATKIIAFPALASFFPLLALFRNYKFN